MDCDLKFMVQLCILSEFDENKWIISLADKLHVDLTSSLLLDVLTETHDDLPVLYLVCIHL